MSKLKWKSTVDGREYPLDTYTTIEKKRTEGAWKHMEPLPKEGYPYTIVGYDVKEPTELLYPKLPEPEGYGPVTLTAREYHVLRSKCNAFDAQVECFERVRRVLNPSEKQLNMPWYEMLASCIEDMAKHLDNEP